VALADLVSYLLAAVASFGNALSNVMQRKASLETAPDTAFGAQVLRSLVRSRTWQLGFAGMVGSFVFQAIALSLGQLSAVETIITLEVPLTLLVASRVFSARLSREEWIAIGVMTAGMAALIGALDPKPGNEAAVNGATYAAAGGGTVLTIAVLIAASRTSRPVIRTALLGASAGTAFGLTATLIKETVDELSTDGVIGMLITWQTYAAIACGLSGVLLMQWAIHSGPLLAAQPGFTLMDPLVSIFWGVLVYNEATRVGGWLVLASFGGLGIAIGVVLLARSPLFAPDDAAISTPAAARVPNG
jgi:drug/metabolite transporter (DMT)-like permease